MGTAAVVFGWTIKLMLFGLVAVFSGLVLTSYATDGAHSPLRFDFEQPARSLEQILVWSGVKLLDWTLRVLRLFWDELTDTSADVGEWFFSTRSPKMQARFRSRFL